VAGRAVNWWLLLPAGLLVATILTAPQVRCRYGWHHWARRPCLADDGGIRWIGECAWCEKPQERQP